MRRAIHAADPDQPVSDVRTMAAILGDQTTSRAIQLRVLATLAAIALVLTAINMFGGFAVTQRMLAMFRK